jgi:adenylate cyclase
MPDPFHREIEFLGEKTIPISEGQTILDAALQAGLPHFHACGGNAECSTCRIMVMEGLEELSAVNELEANLRKIVPFPPRIRLACQTCVEGGPVRVKRIILDKANISSTIKQQITNVNHKLGEKKELVLFFLDIRNFTPFVETYLAFDVIHVMRACYIIFNDLVKGNKGRIIDTAGDGFYAVFGLDSSLQEGADLAITAGQAILRELTRFNETYLHPYFGTNFEIGIGIHCGQVIVGEITVGQRNHLSVMGLAVNVAARIQASTRRLNNTFIASEELLTHATQKVEGQRRLIKLRGVNGVFKVRLIGTPFASSVP